MLLKITIESKNPKYPKYPKYSLMDMGKKELATILMSVKYSKEHSEIPDTVKLYDTLESLLMEAEKRLL